MAWNPNIPTVTNRVQDDLDAIRKNFQHLDPLAPYVQALLDSRIVEMGSNSNGEYVRWENGLQMCWKTDLQLALGASSALQATWTFPAAFVAVASVHVSISTRSLDWTDDSDRRKVSGAVGNASTRPTSDTGIFAFPITGQTFSGNAAVSNCHAFAIGRWK